MLILAAIEGVGGCQSAEVDMDNLEAPVTTLYSPSKAMLVHKMLSQVPPLEVFEVITV